MAQINMADMTPAAEAKRCFGGMRKMTVRAGNQSYQGLMTVACDDRGGVTISIPAFSAPVSKFSKPPR